MTRPGNLRRSSEEANNVLEDQIISGQTLAKRVVRHEGELAAWENATENWKNDTVDLLHRIFDNEYYAHQFDPHPGESLTFKADLPSLIKEHQEEIDLYISRLTHIKGILGRIELLPIRDNTMAKNTSDLPSQEKSASRKIFIVHGHDETLPDKVARLLEKLELEPIILAEQDDESLTVIEKFERYADVWYAVVLLTPDDIGASKANSDLLKDRARQNVILELGYFIGTLGRSNVCVMHKGNVELPSDISGVLYLPVDNAGAWRNKLGGRLKKAGQTVGIEIDMNKLHS